MELTSPVFHVSRTVGENGNENESFNYKLSTLGRLNFGLGASGKSEKPARHLITGFSALQNATWFYFEGEWRRPSDFQPTILKATVKGDCRHFSTKYFQITFSCHNFHISASYNFLMVVKFKIFKRS